MLENTAVRVRSRLRNGKQMVAGEEDSGGIVDPILHFPLKSSIATFGDLLS